MKKTNATVILWMLFICYAHAQQIVFAGKPTLFMPGIVSSPNADVKITFSPDGDLMLWGGIGYIEGKEDQDIWVSEKKNNQWLKPQRATFDTDSNEFDPSFAPDGSGVYFFSNRPGGFGGDDIYFARFDKKSGKFGPAVNLGPIINTAGNEWTPVADPQGKYLYFSSDGHKGYGGQDLFKASINTAGYGQPVNLGNIINGSDNDFDLLILQNGSLIFTSAKGPDKKADLYFAAKFNNRYQAPQKLPAFMNAASYWTFGPSANPKQAGVLYFSSHLTPNLGRTDIYQIGYTFK